jgi:uncharacterized protein (DUF983 family)
MLKGRPQGRPFCFGVIVPRMLRNAPRFRRGALLIRGPPSRGLVLALRSSTEEVLHRVRDTMRFAGLERPMTDATHSALLQTALRGLACKCPRCGKGKLFTGFLNLRPRCEACGLDYAFIDAGDGPAVFIIMIAGAIVVAAALIVEVKYQPPFWVHAALWLPLILATTLLPLRSMKSLLIALQFHHKAAEGRLIDREPK